MCRSPRQFLLAALLLMVTRGAVAEPLRFDLRYHLSPNRSNTVDETAMAGGKLWGPLNGRVAGRVAETALDLEQLEYKAELEWEPVSWASLELRLVHLVTLSDDTSETDLLPMLHLHAWPFSFLEVFGTFGWYERFTLLSKVLFVPTPWRTSYREHDFAADFGIAIRPLDRWLGTVKVATYEQIDVFNLNNPYLEATVEYHPPGVGWTALLYSRYQIVLGFGRLDELLFGAGLKIAME